MSHNIFLESPDCILQAWRDMRYSLQDCKDDEILINTIANFWNKAPISKNYIDPETPKDWSYDWELVESKKYCSFTIGLCIESTFRLLGYKCYILHCVDDFLGDYFAVKYKDYYFNVETNVVKSLPKNTKIIDTYEFKNKRYDFY